MAWVNNNKRNARFNPNRRDDRLLDAEVTARRPPRVQKPTGSDSEEELINTKPDFVLSMESDSRVDWLQMALMQAAEGKLKASALYEVMKHKSFVPSEASYRGKLKAMLTANLHLFSGKQKKALEEAANSWSEGGNESRKRRKSSSSSERKPKQKKDEKDQKEKGKQKTQSSSKPTDDQKGKAKASSSSRSSSSSERTKKAKQAKAAKGKEKKRKSMKLLDEYSEAGHGRCIRAIEVPLEFPLRSPPGESPLRFSLGSWEYWEYWESHWKPSFAKKSLAQEMHPGHKPGRFAEVGPEYLGPNLDGTACGVQALLV
eukprot:Skav208451  [mRNA]  locus=scaffold1104:56857:59375:+ [translate_table: standard]